MKIVLLPGLDGTGVLFKPFIDALLSDIDSLIITYPPDVKLSYLELVNFVMAQLPSEKFVLVGESFSGPIAYQIALRKPDNLSSVIYVATFLSNPSRVLLKLAHMLPVSFLLALPMPKFIIKSLLLGVDANKQIIGLFKQSIKQVSPSVLSFRLQEIAKLSNSHQPCEVKSTYIQATNDKLVSKGCVMDFKKVFNNLSVFQIKGPHFILQANPVACADIVANEVRLITNGSSATRNGTRAPYP